MAQVAKECKETAEADLIEAIRQAKRYIQTHKPSKRIVQQRADKVVEATHEFKRCYYTFCMKTDVDVNSLEAAKYLQERADQAMDVTDECTMIIEDLDEKLRLEHDNARQQESEEAERRKAESQVQKVNLERSIDERLAVEICAKVREITANDEISPEDSCRLKTYTERLEELLPKLQNWWSELMEVKHETKDDEKAFTEEIYGVTSNIEGAITDAVACLRKSEPEKPNEAESKSNEEGRDTLKAERVSLPSFSGDIRSFATFRKDFTNIVISFYPSKKSQAYIMRNRLLHGKAKDLVKNIDSIEDMWSRLEDKFGDKLDLVEVVLEEIRMLPQLKPNEDQKFIDMVDAVERGLHDLEAIDAKADLDNAYTVKLIEKKLNNHMFKDWLRMEQKVEGMSRFDKLLSFLVDERRRAQKLVNRSTENKSGSIGSGSGIASGATYGVKKEKSMAGNGEINSSGKSNKDCLIHTDAHSHFTRRCKAFLRKSPKERAEFLVSTKGCALCLSKHEEVECPWLVKWGGCKIDSCGLPHSHLLHEAYKQQEETNRVALNRGTAEFLGNGTMLLVQKIPTTKGELTSFFDNGSTISFVSKRYVMKHSMKGIQISYELVTIGGEVKHQTSFLHNIQLIDKKGVTHPIPALEIEDVCGTLREHRVKAIKVASKLFKRLSWKDVVRPRGEIDLLIGMKHAKIHPTKIAEAGDLVLYKSVFGTGRVLGGCHKFFHGNDELSAAAQVVAFGKVMNLRVMMEKNADTGIDFFSSEDFGIKHFPRCDRCKGCKSCNSKKHHMSREEQRELTVIKQNLTLDPVEGKWTTTYPFKSDPGLLEDNFEQALSILHRTERRLLSSEDHSLQYRKQVQDFIDRGVLRLITAEELLAWADPKFYVTMHEVFKEDSSSTPLRVVTNTSLKFKGKSLNDTLMKGPNVLNDLYGIQLRFRSYQVGLVTDIKKMYHSIGTTERERHLRRVLWRDLDQKQEVKIYGSEKVMFGDRPAATIASTAVTETARIFTDVHPEAAKRIIEDSYVDDVVTGADHKREVEKLKEGITEILDKGGFHVKGFVSSGDFSKEVISLLGTGEVGRVLGIGWNPTLDVFQVKVRINFSKKWRQARTERDMTCEELPKMSAMRVTRRLLLSVCNSCYDPLGLLSPISIGMKIALRELHVMEQKFKWDDELPEYIKKQWVQILTKVKKAESTTFKRCIKPEDAKGEAELVIFNDASNVAMCAAAYVRWLRNDGSVSCRLWTAKTRVTPIRKSTTPRNEIQSAVMAVRLAESIKKNAIWSFDSIYHITDSMCLLGILSKDTSALGEFYGNRVDEILDTTTTQQWYHVGTKDNIADLGTRGTAKIEDISEDSEYQIGPKWIYLPKKEWPLNQDKSKSTVPQEALVHIKIAAAADGRECIIDFERYRGRRWNFVRNIIARIFRIFANKGFKNNEPQVEDSTKAEEFMVKMSSRLTKEIYDAGKLVSIGPQLRHDGVILLAGRALEGLQKNYERNEFPILTYGDPLAYIWMQSVHEEDHTGITRTVAKSRRRFWIIKARKLATKIKSRCYDCRKIDKQLAQQMMAPLPTARQVMSPTFNEVAIDLFGPFTVRDAVRRRVTKKLWGIIVSCLVTRAIHLDTTDDYSTESAIESLRKFFALRGCPTKIYSDKGSQLAKTAKIFRSWAVSKNIDWHETPAEGQHQNGVSESMIRSTKRSLCHTIGETVLTPSGLQMVLFEAANLINGRPIGIVTGSDPRQPSPITPNHLILGRATADVVPGPFDNTQDMSRRLRFLNTLVEDWWHRWYESVLPSLVPSYKWHQRHRNVRVGDICIIKYKNEIKGRYHLGRVTHVKIGSDNLVRTIKLEYKNADESVFREVTRPIHGVAVIVPVEEQSVLNPKVEDFKPKSKMSS